MGDIGDLVLPSMVGTIEKMLEQAREDTFIKVLCGDGCWGETFALQIVGREVRTICLRCDKTIMRHHLIADDEPPAENGRS